MRLGLLATTLALGLSGPASASVFLDFTSGSVSVPPPVTSSVTDVATSLAGVTYSITAGVPPTGSNPTGAATLVNSTHRNNVGCAPDPVKNTFAEFSCAPRNGEFDVGFGVLGGANNNEIDGIAQGEFVKVKFSTAVILNGFAGMLTYTQNASPTLNLEKVVLKAFYMGVELPDLLEATPVFLVKEPGPVNGVPVVAENFNTVGLAFLDGLKLKVDEVRFLAGGLGSFDDGNANITAAGLKISAVPLPAGVLLLGLGLGGLAVYRRRQTA